MLVGSFFCCFKTLVFYIKTIDKYCFLLYNIDNTRSVFSESARSGNEE